jgi:hypothetical protein
MRLGLRGSKRCSLGRRLCVGQAVSKSSEFVRSFVRLFILAAIAIMPASASLIEIQ